MDLHLHDGHVPAFFAKKPVYEKSRPFDLLSHFRDLRGSTLRYPAFVETPLPVAFLLVSRPASYPINNKTDLFQGRFVVSRSTGLEPVASTVTGWRDNQPHQDPKCIMKLQYLIPFVNLDDKKSSN